MEGGRTTNIRGYQRKDKAVNTDQGCNCMHNWRYGSIWIGWCCWYGTAHNCGSRIFWSQDLLLLHIAQLSTYCTYDLSQFQLLIVGRLQNLERYISQRSNSHSSFARRLSHWVLISSLAPASVAQHKSPRCRWSAIHGSSWGSIPTYLSTFSASFDSRPQPIPYLLGTSTLQLPSVVVPEHVRPLFFFLSS
jgi:hypothetical protein